MQIKVKDSSSRREFSNDEIDHYMIPDAVHVEKIVVSTHSILLDSSDLDFLQLKVGEKVEIVITRKL
jgi:hypothetical protein